MPRQQYIFRGCLLLLGIAAPVIAVFLWLLSGELADILSRLGIILASVGILSIVPDIVGEKQLEKILSNVEGYQRTQQYLKEYLYSSRETPKQASQPLLVVLSLFGNFIISFLMIFLSISLIFSDFQDVGMKIGLTFVFGFLAIESVTWIVLLLFFVAFRSFVYRLPNLFAYFITTNSLISALGVLISSALAYLLIGIIPLLISIAKIPIRKTISLVTIPFVIIGALLQIAATFF